MEIIETPDLQWRLISMVVNRKDLEWNKWLAIPVVHQGEPADQQDGEAGRQDGEAEQVVLNLDKYDLW